ncbi:MAG: YkvA family protein [Anaerolineae bacterium]
MNQQKDHTPDVGVLVRAARWVQLVWRLMLDPRVPLVTKMILLGTAVYVISPIDLIPDMFPVIGQLDDIGVIFLGLRWFIGMCPPDVVLEHQRALGVAPSAKSDEYVDATYQVVDDDK